MTAGKMSAMILGFVGAFGLGVWSGPHIVNRAPDASTVAGSGVPAIESTATPESAPVTAARARAEERAAERAAVDAVVANVPVSEPALHERLRPVLNRGANMDIAADGFKSAEEFATVAHAARNVDVPFLVLKHQVLDEGKSLTEAIRASKPTVNAAAEAELARAQARADLANVAGHRAS
jgi:hypothetical protein